MDTMPFPVLYLDNMKKHGITILCVKVRGGVVPVIHPDDDPKESTDHGTGGDGGELARVTRRERRASYRLRRETPMDGRREEMPAYCVLSSDAPLLLAATAAAAAAVAAAAAAVAMRSSRKPQSLRERTGCCNLRTALASI